MPYLGQDFQEIIVSDISLRHLNEKKIFFAVLLFGLYGFYKYKIDGFSIRFSHREECRVLSKEMEFCVKNKNNNEIIFCGWGFQPTIRYLFEGHNWNKKFAGVYLEKICFSNNISYNCVKAKEFNVRFYIFLI